MKILLLFALFFNLQSNITLAAPQLTIGTKVIEPFVIKKESDEFYSFSTHKTVLVKLF